jgi:nucleotide-binding universal stress UspA family protein
MTRTSVREQRPGPDREPGRRILVGYDGSPSAERALRWAADKAGACRGRVVVVHCMPASPVEEEPLEWTEWYGQHVADEGARIVRARGHQIAVETHFVYGDPSFELVSLAEPDDVLVVGAHPQYGDDSDVPSVDSYIRQHAACPIVVVPTEFPHSSDVAEETAP